MEVHKLFIENNSNFNKDDEINKLNNLISFYYILITQE